jgi:hypothetical protein
LFSLRKLSVVVRILQNIFVLYWENCIFEGW